MFLFGQVKFEGSGALESSQSLIYKLRNFRLRVVFPSMEGQGDVTIERFFLTVKGRRKT